MAEPVSEARLRAQNDAKRARMFGRTPNVSESRVRRDVADFRRLGLAEADAERAAMSVQRGTYSFREAAMMCSTFSDQSRLKRELLPTVERERAAVDAAESRVDVATADESSIEAELAAVRQREHELREALKARREVRS